LNKFNVQFIKVVVLLKYLLVWQLNSKSNTLVYTIY
jgi:hypothetical protein